MAEEQTDWQPLHLGKLDKEEGTTVGVSVAGGAATGAALGSIAGPIGTIAGGVIGGIVGLFGAQKQIDKQRSDEKLAKKHARMRKDAEASAESARRGEEAVAREMGARRAKEGSAPPPPSFGADEILRGATVHGPGSPYDNSMMSSYGRSTVKEA